MGAPGLQLPAPPTPAAAADAESLGFSTTLDGRLVAFGSQTGVIRASIPLGNEVLDLQWLPRACRVVARVHGQAASQRVFSFALHRTTGTQLELTLEAASEELWGHTQILGVGGGLRASGQPAVEALWLSFGDPAPTWQRWDAALNPLRGEAAWTEPLDWEALADGSVIALLGSGEASELALATLHSETPRIDRRPLPHATALVAEGARVWVWRQAAGIASVQQLELPSFKLISESTNFPPSRPSALAASASRLAAYQIDSDGSVRVFLQAAGQTRTQRFGGLASRSSRPLAFQGDYLWLARESGVTRLHVPALTQRRNFDGAALRAPLLVPPEKTLRCIR